MSREMQQRFSIITWRASVDDNLTDSEYRTLGVIAAYADKDGWCYPSQSHIADKRGLSRQTINTHVKKLRELGYLVIRHRARDDGGQTSNKMQVRLDFPPAHEDGGCQPQTRRGVSGSDLTRGVGSRLDTNIPEEQYQTNTYTHEEPSVENPPMEETTSPREARKRTAGENKAKDKPLFKPVLENEPEEESSAPRELSRNEATSLLADVFCEATGLKVPPSISHAAFNKLWRTPLWEIYQLCENDIDVAAVAVKEVCSHMRNEDLTISRPLSIINIARDRIAQGKHLSHLDDVQAGEEGGLWL